MRALVFALIAVLSVALAGGTQAQQPSGPGPSQADREAAIRRAAAALRPQPATIVLANGIARVDSARLQYLSPADTEKLLVDVWGNPRGSSEGSLGALVPLQFDALADESWAIILSYSADGHVADDDAAGIDYAELLRDMKLQVREQNEERKRLGSYELELVGWARPPFYDKATHKLHWAKQLGTPGGDTLNYNVRVLGREGVLVLNFIASMDNLADIEKAIPGVLADVNFTDGNRYEQYQPGSDRLAEYGIAALIAGVALKKVGLFAGIVAAILAAKKVVIVGVIALFAGITGFFRRLRRGSRLPPPTQPPPAA